MVTYMYVHTGAHAHAKGTMYMYIGSCGMCAHVV